MGVIFLAIGSLRGGANNALESMRGIPLIWGYINLGLLAFIVIGTWMVHRKNKKLPAPYAPKRGRPRKVQN